MAARKNIVGALALCSVLSSIVVPSEAFAVPFGRFLKSLVGIGDDAGRAGQKAGQVPDLPARPGRVPPGLGDYEFWSRDRGASPQSLDPGVLPHRRLLDEGAALSAELSRQAGVARFPTRPYVSEAVRKRAAKSFDPATETRIKWLAGDNGRAALASLRHWAGRSSSEDSDESDDSRGKIRPGTSSYRVYLWEDRMFGEGDAELTVRPACGGWEVVYGSKIDFALTAPDGNRAAVSLRSEFHGWEDASGDQLFRSGLNSAVEERGELETVLESQPFQEIWSRGTKGMVQGAQTEVSHRTYDQSVQFPIAWSRRLMTDLERGAEGANGRFAAWNQEQPVESATIFDPIKIDGLPGELWLVRSADYKYEIGSPGEQPGWVASRHVLSIIDVHGEILYSETENVGQGLEIQILQDWRPESEGDCEARSRAKWVDLGKSPDESLSRPILEGEPSVQANLDEANAHFSTARTLLVEGKERESIDNATLALVVLEPLIGKGDRKVGRLHAEVLAFIAVLETAIESPGASDLLRRAIAAEREFPWADDPLQSLTTYCLVSRLLVDGEWAEADRHSSALQQSLKSFARPGDPLMQLATLQRGLSLSSMERWSEAGRMFRRLVTIQDEMSPRNPAGFFAPSDALRGLVYIALKEHDLAAADRYARQALDTAKLAQPTDEELLAGSPDCGLRFLASNVPDFRPVAVERERLRQEQIIVELRRARIGILKLGGQNQEARLLEEELVLEVLIQSAGPEHPWVAEKLLEMAGLHRRVGQIEEALALEQRAEKILK